MEAIACPKSVYGFLTVSMEPRDLTNHRCLNFRPDDSRRRHSEPLSTHFDCRAIRIRRLQCVDRLRTATSVNLRRHSFKSAPNKELARKWSSRCRQQPVANAVPDTVRTVGPGRDRPERLNHSANPSNRSRDEPVGEIVPETRGCQETNRVKILSKEPSETCIQISDK